MKERERNSNKGTRIRRKRLKTNYILDGGLVQSKNDHSVTHISVGMQ